MERQVLSAEFFRRQTIWFGFFKQVLGNN